MKKTVRNLILTVTGFLIISQVKAQTIEIGQSAEEIKHLIEWTTKDHNKPDTYGNRSNSRWTWDVIYQNGQIVDVIQCYRNQYLIDFGAVADYCKHYMMENSKLAYILTQFENISLEKLQLNYNSEYSNNKIGKYYFSDDYEHYSQLYLANNGLATIEWRKTVISELSIDVQSTVKSKLFSIREEKKIKKEKETLALKTKEELDKNEKFYTVLVCEDFSDGLALVGIDTEHKSGEMNYGYGQKAFGYINEKGEYAVFPKYEKAFSFSNGFALVTTNSRYTNNWEYINSKGENVFNKKFADARSFSEGFAAVRTENGGYGFIDISGNLITKAQYEQVGDFKEGMAKVKFQGKWGYIDKVGNEIVIPQFYQANDFSEGLAMVSQTVNYRKQYSYIDKSGKIAIRLNEGDAPVFSDNYYTGFGMGGLDKDKIEFPFSNFHGGLAMIYSDKIGNYFIDNTGKAILKPKKGNWNCYRFIVYAFINEFAISELCGKYGYLDTKGKWAVKAMFDNVGNFHDGLARVQINKNWGYIDASGNVVINKDILKPQTDIQTSAPFDEASDFSEGFAIVRTRKKLGYIDKAGNWAFPLEIGAARPFKNGMARVKLMNKKGWNFIDKNGNILFPNFL